jgi:putative transcriptional regulator
MKDGELTGRLLVATPMLVDPNFDRTVVLVLDHDADGTLGVVVNRPTAVPVREVLPDWSELAEPLPVVFQGGPVALDSVLGLAELRTIKATEQDPVGWRRVHGDLGLVDLDTPPEKLAAQISAFRIYAGYAGWSSGQLERELKHGAWYVVDNAPGDAFTLDPEHTWRAVLRRQRNDLALLSTYPDDPGLN